MKLPLVKMELKESQKKVQLSKVIFLVKFEIFIFCL